MNCVILQPSYIPWRGYFHQIQKSDVFVFYDDIQYDKHGWRNRNRIKTANGSQWLTIPVLKKGNVEKSRKIREIEIAWDRPWNRRHLAAITQSYGKAPYFDWLQPLLNKWYAQTPVLLADFTIALTIELAACLGIRNTRFVRSSEINVGGSRTDRLIEIVRAVGCDHYVSGPAARNYLEEGRFHSAGVTLEYMTYAYDEYPQLYPVFDPNVSILDLMMMTGERAPLHIWAP
jgi:hypothetical protein